MPLFPELLDGGPGGKLSPQGPGEQGLRRARWARDTMKLVFKNGIYFLGQGRHTRLDTEKGPFYNNMLPRSRAPPSQQL